MKEFLLTLFVVIPMLAMTFAFIGEPLVDLILWFTPNKQQTTNE